MKKIVFLSSLVLAATVAAAPVAFAQTDDQPSCAEALATMNQAQANLDVAVKADEAAAAAKAADEALVQAEKAHAAALKAHEEATPVEFRPTPATQEEIDRLVKANETTPVENIGPRIAAIQAVMKAEADLAKARTEAAKADAAALQVEADKTNAEALAEAEATAKLVADEACRGPQGEPGQNGGSNDNGSGGGSGTGGNTTPDDSDFDQVGSVPVGGVATGGGPA